ncbi:MAG: GNAT family N-acetyltransferase [Pseudomonadota bacterium]|nr:MAG: GNAT family N-acetyltransferase [Pseudomonadota bacterium]
MFQTSENSVLNFCSCSIFCSTIFFERRADNDHSIQICNDRSRPRSLFCRPHRGFCERAECAAELERDEHDDSAAHILAEDENGCILGTARLRYLDNIAKIERVAVLEEARGKGIGRGIMAFIIEKAAEKGDIAKLKLGSQSHAIPFYAALGFKTVGEEYMDAGIPHRDMVKDNQIKG